MIRSIFITSLCIMLSFATGCEINRANSDDTLAARRGGAIGSVTVTGPYAIAPDGSVSWNATARPDGDLLDTRVARKLTKDSADQWIRETTIGAGGSIARIRSIIGPYRLDPDDSDDPMLYDVTLEIWASRSGS
tara:strand:+ start:148 stop:549 length:402 start_codon:yes stop_codon:yes gene_type:complete